MRFDAAACERCIAAARSAERPSNRRIATVERERVLDVVLQRSADFGPTPAAEYLREQHGYRTVWKRLRQWLLAAHLWQRSDCGASAPFSYANGARAWANWPKSMAVWLEDKRYLNVDLLWEARKDQMRKGRVTHLMTTLLHILTNIDHSGAKPARAIILRGMVDVPLSPDYELPERFDDESLTLGRGVQARRGECTSALQSRRVGGRYCEPEDTDYCYGTIRYIDALNEEQFTQFVTSLSVTATSPMPVERQ